VRGELGPVVGRQHQHAHADADRQRQADERAPAGRPPQVGRRLRQHAPHDRDAGEAGQRLEHHRQPDEGPHVGVEEVGVPVRDGACELARGPQHGLHQHAREQDGPQAQTQPGDVEERAAGKDHCGHGGNALADDGAHSIEDCPRRGGRATKRRIRGASSRRAGPGCRDGATQNGGGGALA
jgi:hypothetical protein